MKIQIKNRYTNEIIFETEKDSLKLAVEEAIEKNINLSGANLIWANLSKANLSEANLSEANLSKANLSKANLSKANLSEANLSEANLIWANLSNANLSYADLIWANLSWANLSNANLSKANLSEANLSEANLSEANLSNANLSKANLSMAKNLTNNTKDFIKNFKFNKEGMIVYKAIGNTQYTLNPNWKIEKGEYLEENVNSCKADDCGCGVNFGTLKYVKKEYPKSDIWECLIEFRDLVEVVVPYRTDGKARCSRLKLIRKLK